jgi:hypothetical protein
LYNELMTAGVWTVMEKSGWQGQGHKRGT